MNDPISDDRPARRAGAKALGDATVLTAGVALVIALVGMLNYLAFRHHVRFDWTASQLYTLSTLGRDAVVGVEEDVEVLVVLRPESELATAVEELLAQIRAANPRITWRALDLTRNPIEAQALVARYGVERENVVIVQRGDERRVINEFDLAEFDYGDGQLDQAPALRAFRGEGQIISAILAVTRAEAPRVVFTRGHGEADPFGANTDRGFAAATELLGRDNFRYDTVDTLAGDALDPDAIDLLVVAGPTTTFQPGELSAFDRYLQAGGRMLWLLDPALDLTATAFAARGPDEDLRAWLARYGVALGNDLVVDPVQRIIGFGPETLLADTYGDHPIVEPLRASGVPVLLPLARSVARAADGPTDPALASAEIIELISSGADAWSERDLDSLDSVARDDDEPTGPLPLGVAVRLTPTEPLFDRATAAGPGRDLSRLRLADRAADDEAASAADAPTSAEALDAAGDGDGEPRDARLVVIGDFDFASDAQVVQAGNAQLLLGALSWLVERDALLAIPPRRADATRLLLNQQQLVTFFWLLVLLLPGLAFGVGAAVYFQRRR